MQFKEEKVKIDNIGETTTYTGKDGKTYIVLPKTIDDKDDPNTFRVAVVINGEYDTDQTVLISKNEIEKNKPETTSTERKKYIATIKDGKILKVEQTNWDHTPTEIQSLLKRSMEQAGYKVQKSKILSADDEKVLVFFSAGKENQRIRSFQFSVQADQSVYLYDIKYRTYLTNLDNQKELIGMLRDTSKINKTPWKVNVESSITKYTQSLTEAPWLTLQDTETGKKRGFDLETERFSDAGDFIKWMGELFAGDKKTDKYGASVELKDTEDKKTFAKALSDSKIFQTFVGYTFSETQKELLEIILNF